MLLPEFEHPFWHFKVTVRKAYNYQVASACTTIVEHAEANGL